MFPAVLQQTQLCRPAYPNLRRLTATQLLTLPGPQPERIGRVAQPTWRPRGFHPSCKNRQAPASRSRVAAAVPPVVAAPVLPHPRMPVDRRQSVAFSAGQDIVQRVKFFPNLHPGATLPVDQNSMYKLGSFADRYRIERLNSHVVHVPNLQYNFVRNRGGELLLHSRHNHPSLATGRDVLYAGEMYFDNGHLNWWSNGSGHYQPESEFAEQAALPMDKFYSYQQIIKGEHLRKNSNPDSGSDAAGNRAART